MGFSGWFHLDFQKISAETDTQFKLVLNDLSEIWVKKNQVADRRDYKKGDRNGVISITEQHAIKRGLIND